MKKFLILLLVLVCVGAGSVAAISLLDDTPETPEQPSVGELDVFTAAAKGSVPTKIVSLTTYAGKDMFGKELLLSGNFVQISKGTNSILDYKYDRLATPAEAASGSKVTVEGAIAMKNGTYKQYGMEMDWQALIPSLQQLGSLKIDKDTMPKDYKLSSDGKKLTVSLNREEALKVLGVALGDLQGEVALDIQTNGKNVSSIDISYTMASGATVSFSTSYTYGNETLDFSRFN